MGPWTRRKRLYQHYRMSCSCKNMFRLQTSFFVEKNWQFGLTTFLLFLLWIQIGTFGFLRFFLVLLIRTDDISIHIDTTKIKKCGLTTVYLSISVSNGFRFRWENRNRKSATETETDSKYFCHRNRKLKPIDKNQLIIAQYEKSETTKENGVLFLLHFLIVSKNSVCKRLRLF